MRGMRKWFGRNREGILKSVYSLPICFAIVISIFHCIEWFAISNPSIFAIAMSVALEVAAATTLIALLTGKLTISIIATFIFVTIYQVLGNIFFSFNYINEDSQLFTTWVSFMNIILGENNQWSAEIHRFWLSVMSGAVVPGLSLLSLHLIATFELKDKNVVQETIEEETEEIPEKEVIETVEIKRETPVIEYPISVEEKHVDVSIPSEDIIPPYEMPDIKKDVQKSKIVLGNQPPAFVKSTKPAVVEQPPEKPGKRIKLPGFKR
jgi:hypothetical protein